MSAIHPWLTAWAPWVQWAYGTTVELPVFLPLVNEQARTVGVLSGLGNPVTFGESSAVLSAVAYEQTIALTGCIPTRDNLHDRYNAIAWLGFPKTKQCLNRLQVQDIAKGVEGRSRFRDALTLFDENGAILVTGSEAIADRLRNFHWNALFVEHRQEWLDKAEVFLLGHGLMEKLEQPFPGLCAHTAIIVMDEVRFATFRQVSDSQLRRAMVDELASDWVSKSLTGSMCLQPLPVLGIPGWWSANEMTDFYDNPSVFRAGRRRLYKP